MPTEPDPAEQVRKLLRSYGRTYAQEAGIRLSDKPSPLYQLLVLATLLSARISSGVAIAAARELFAAGLRTPAGASIFLREVQEAWPWSGSRSTATPHWTTRNPA